MKNTFRAVLRIGRPRSQSSGIPGKMDLDVMAMSQPYRTGIFVPKRTLKFLSTVSEAVKQVNTAIGH
jgi:hypothetical protein